MDPAEWNYEIYNCEMLAIIEALKDWRNFLEGLPNPFEILTDHRNLEHWRTAQDLSRRQARWAEFLGPFDFHVNHRAGRLAQKVDVLTRRRDVYPRNSDNPNLQAHHLQSLLQPKHLLANLILDSTVIHEQINQGLHTDPTTPTPPAASNTLDASNTHTDPRFTTNEHGQVLFADRLFVPDTDNLRLLITQSHHDHALAGHPGIKKTIQLIKRRFNWPGLDKFVTDFVKSCPDCRRAKAIRHKPFGPLRFLPIPERPWSSLSMDFIEGLPPSDGHDSILVVVDRLTKMSIFIPTHKTLTSPQLARLFIQHVFAKHGVPIDIVSDRGRHFISRFWADLCSALGIQSTLATAYHPETDGQTERVNQEIEQYLRLFINYHQSDWADWLALAKFSYNNKQHSATGFSPFYVNHGQHPYKGTEPDFAGSMVPGAAEFVEKMESIRKETEAALSLAAETMKKYYDRSRLPAHPYKVGDKVYLEGINLSISRPMAKLSDKRYGPFRIVKKVGASAYKLALPQKWSRNHDVFNEYLLTPFTAPSYPSQ